MTSNDVPRQKPPKYVIQARTTKDVGDALARVASRSGRSLTATVVRLILAADRKGGAV